MIYDLDSGEMLTREEYNKRQNEREARDMEGIDEEDDDDDGDDDVEDEEEDGEDDAGT